jgi:hypothetical protein
VVPLKDTLEKVEEEMVLRVVMVMSILLVTCAAMAAENPVNKEGTVSMQPEKDLMEGVPADFPRFFFPESATHAQYLSRYLWYHFTKRAGDGLCLFNKEYLLTSDIWMNGATATARQKPIQQVHREDLLGIQIDPEGYVNTHQHFSHAHDWGWPFPMWVQGAGKANGWHFQNGQIPGWSNDFLQTPGGRQFTGDRAVAVWQIKDLESQGIVGEKWSLKGTGNNPTLITPEMAMDSFNSPFVQLRWSRSGSAHLNNNLPYLEWRCEGDSDFSPERRMYFDHNGEALNGKEGHSIVPVSLHPQWTGTIKQIRICLAPDESGIDFKIDSFFSVYDTRHSINNPIFILASWQYFLWTGDIPFLYQQIDRMRLALAYQQTVMGGLEFNRQRNQWVGHDGLPGYTFKADGTKEIQGGHGIGNNYWDLLPFGWDDLYATSQYYTALLNMAAAEQAIRDNPAWAVPISARAFNPDDLRTHAAAVKTEANRLFWKEETGRFVACIDKNGAAHDYGLTFLNLDAIWYGIASDEHARSIMDWISGKRIVAGDTSTGADIYNWRFGPRATTLRNLDWYGQGWTAPETIPWGGQIQDGGGVLGFSFYDLWARLKVYSPDDAWSRLSGLLDWEKEVIDFGGYREYYKDGNHGSTLQGGGTAGGIGVDCEFFESSLPPTIVVKGFLGLEPNGTALTIHPQLPKQCPEMKTTNLLYHNVPLDVAAGENWIEVTLHTVPQEPVQISLDGDWNLAMNGTTGAHFLLNEARMYRFEKK